MQQRRLGRSGLAVSRLALGTMTWGTDTDQHEAREQLAGFTGAGGTLVETSPGYGDGAAERLLGSLLGDVAAREQVVLASTAGGPPGAAEAADTSRRGLLQALDGSLERLGTDRVDLWQVPWSTAAPLAETLAAVDHAVATGRAVHAGVCGYLGWQTAQAATWQQAWPGRTPLVSSQAEYSLVNRSVEAEVLPAARALGIGVLARSPLGGGVLTGKYRGGTPADSRAASSRLSPSVAGYLDERSARIVEGVARAADGLGWSPAAVALAWVRDRPGVGAAVVGARTAAQLRSLLGVERHVLPGEIRHALDDVSEQAR